MKASEIAQMVSDGAKFAINFQKRTCSVNGKVLVSDHDDIKLGLSVEEILETIEFLYGIYKHSVPSERSESHRRCYFKALPEKDLSDEDMMYGERRETARFNLEFYVLSALISGELKWDDEWGSWFWQSTADKDLVILREWVEPKRGKEETK